MNHTKLEKKSLTPYLASELTRKMNMFLCPPARVTCRSYVMFYDSRRRAPALRGLVDEGVHI